MEVHILINSSLTIPLVVFSIMTTEGMGEQT